MRETAIKGRYHNGSPKLGIQVDLHETNTAEVTTTTTAQTVLHSLPVPVNKAIRVAGFVLARNGANVASYSFQGLVKNAGGTTALVGTPVYSEVCEDAALSTAAVVIAANDTTDALEVRVTGIAGTVVWSGQINAAAF